MRKDPPARSGPSPNPPPTPSSGRCLGATQSRPQPTTNFDQTERPRKGDLGRSRREEGRRGRCSLSCPTPRRAPSPGTTGNRGEGSLSRCPVRTPLSVRSGARALAKGHGPLNDPSNSAGSRLCGFFSIHMCSSVITFSLMTFSQWVLFSPFLYCT